MDPTDRPHPRDPARQEAGWVVRADVVDPRVPAPGEILSVEQGTAKAIGEPVELTMRAGTEVVVTGTESRPVEQSRAQEAGDR